MVEALPVGNGRWAHGYGNVKKERIGLTESTVWSGAQVLQTKFRMR